MGQSDWEFWEFLKQLEEEVFDDGLGEISFFTDAEVAKNGTATDVIGNEAERQQAEVARDFGVLETGRNQLGNEERFSGNVQRVNESGLDLFSRESGSDLHYFSADNRADVFAPNVMTNQQMRNRQMAVHENEIFGAKSKILERENVLGFGEGKQERMADFSGEGTSEVMLGKIYQLLAKENESAGNDTSGNVSVHIGQVRETADLERLMEQISRKLWESRQASARRSVGR